MLQGIITWNQRSIIELIRNLLSFYGIWIQLHKVNGSSTFKRLQIFIWRLTCWIIPKCLNGKHQVVHYDRQKDEESRWRLSLWKLQWKGLLVYIDMFLVISMIYQIFQSTEKQLEVEVQSIMQTNSSYYKLSLPVIYTDWFNIFKFMLILFILLLNKINSFKFQSTVNSLS